MNKYELLDLLLADAKIRGTDRYEYAKNYELAESLIALNNGREIRLPPSLPRDAKRMIPILRKHFDDRVTFVSLVLNYYFPDKYIFYRVSHLEEEIFEGLDFLAEAAPELGLSFSRVGRRGFDRYLKLNEVLQKFARISWPDSRNPQDMLTYFLYEGLGHLFLRKSDYNRYWIHVSGGQASFDELDSNDTVEWSGRKEMQIGDLTFMYRTTPRKAVTDIFRVKDEPFFDPWGEWNGFWVNMERVCKVKDIPFTKMRKDPVLGGWGSVRKKFTGSVVDPVPHSIYNRLLEKIPEATKKKHGLEPEPVAKNIESLGHYGIEEQFEDEVVVPLLQRWSLNYQRQYPCNFRFGSQDHRGRVDFYVSDERGPLTLFENKLKILPNNKDLELATNQAKSYALMLGLPSFVVASPEGIWLYSLNKNNVKLERQIAAGEIQQRDEELRDALLKIRG